MRELTQRFIRRRLSSLGFVPRTKLARFSVLTLGFELVIYVVQQVMAVTGKLQGAAGLDGWIRFLTLLNILLLGFLTLRWGRNVLMWRLRNRLIIAYTFIGVIPVLLIGAMALFAGYLFAGQFAALAATTDIQTELKGLQAMNSVITAQIESTLRRGGPVSSNAVSKLTSETYAHFSRAEFSAWYRGQQLMLKQPGEGTTTDMPPPAWVQDKFIGVVSAPDHKLYLRAVNVAPLGGDSLTVVSSLPLDQQTITAATAGLGEITVYRGLKNLRLNSGMFDVDLSDDSKKPNPQPAPENKTTEPAVHVTGGVLPQAANALDREIAFATVLPYNDWQSGQRYDLFLAVSTRTSMLYRRLFSTYSDIAEASRLALVFLAVFFSFLELFALMIGLRLTRTITKSVSDLYHGTQRVNRGDFSHRIEVRRHDQLAALEGSFNSMTASLEKLIAEQKEKQKLENELAIAQEVQEMLFPRSDLQVASLELHGVCRPARTVSGDYYDFLPLGQERMALAVGDISGKGISAALLMATIHSAVRVYEFGSMPSAATLSAVGKAALAAAQPQEGVVAASLFVHGNGMQSPCQVLWLLNRHVFHSTQPEKYATLFLGVYDGGNRVLTYSNAGHLPPLVIHESGEISRLESGGTVIGLFENVQYEEQTVQLRKGDLFVAYSDGITEPENEFGEFGEKRLVEILLENQHLPLPRLSEIVTTAVQDWNGSGDLPDDVTLVLARAR